MRRFFQFLYRFRVFILFLVLEGIGFWLVVNNNPYQEAAYFNASSTATASALQLSDNVTGFIDLKQQNQKLIKENLKLKQVLINQAFNTISNVDSTETDTTIISLLSANVINKTLFFQNNYITIDRGLKDGLEVGMGVIGPNGLVGQVKTVSKNYASVYSLLHSSVLVSSVHQKSNSLCTTKWTGEDPSYSSIEYLPKHVSIDIGDTIKTSGYNAIFPKNTVIGVVDNVGLSDNSTFQKISIKNATDFYTLSHVYLVFNRMKIEKDSLEQDHLTQ